MCPTRAQSGRQSSKTKSGSVSLLLYRGPAQSPLWTERKWGIVPSTLYLAHASVQEGIIATPHCCPPRVTLWYPVPAVSAMVSVPRWLWESPPCSALHHSPHVPFTYKYPSLFKVSLYYRLTDRTQGWDFGHQSSMPSFPTAPGKLFHCFMPLSAWKGWGIAYSHTNH